MKITRELKRAEAIARMKKLGIFKETIRQFEEEELLSESQPPFGACYFVQGEQLERVRKFEKEHDALVYFIIHSYANIGELENYLYVSDYMDEWSIDTDDISNGKVFAYVANLTCEQNSEFGTIGVERTPAAGLRRTW